MRTKLFHTIVLCGAALGGVVGCSGDGDDSGDTEQEATGTGGGTHCATGGSGAAPAAGGVAGGGAPGSGASAACGGWPTTK